MTVDQFVSSLTNEQREFLIKWIKQIESNFELPAELINDGNK